MFSTLTVDLLDLQSAAWFCLVAPLRLSWDKTVQPASLPCHR